MNLGVCVSEDLKNYYYSVRNCWSDSIGYWREEVIKMISYSFWVRHDKFPTDKTLYWDFDDLSGIKFLKRNQTLREAVGLDLSTESNN